MWQLSHDNTSGQLGRLNSLFHDRPPVASPPLSEVCITTKGAAIEAKTELGRAGKAQVLEFRKASDYMEVFLNVS
jgi:hypothetical protein